MRQLSFQEGDLSSGEPTPPLEREPVEGGAVLHAAPSARAAISRPVTAARPLYKPSPRLFFALRARLLKQAVEPEAGRETIRWFRFRSKLWRIGHELWPNPRDFTRHCEGLLRGQVPWRKN